MGLANQYMLLKMMKNGYFDVLVSFQEVMCNFEYYRKDRIMYVKGVIYKEVFFDIFLKDRV